MEEKLFSEDFLHQLERLTLAARKATPGQMQGERRSPKRGQSVEFADFRPYVLGDDIRRIDWNAYARLERFFIKLFVEEEDLLVHLLLDTSRSMDWGKPNKLWYSARAAAAIGYVALTGLDRVTVTALGRNNGRSNGNGAPNRYFPPHRGKRQAMALFTFLQKLEAEPEHKGNSGSGIARKLAAYAAGATHPGPLLLFSDLMEDGWLDGVRALASRGFEISVVHVLAPEEVNPQIDGDFKLVDSEDRQAVEITGDYDLLARYRQGLQDWQAQWNAFCRARGIRYVPLQTTLPFDELLFAWMRRQGVLR